MCLLIAEIIMVIGGLYAIIAGRVKLTKNMTLEGTRARVAGLFLLAPLPLALLIGFVIGFLSGGDPDASSIAVIIEMFLVVGGLLGAVLFATLTKPKASAPPDDTLPPTPS
jgi:hypothetical protein